MQNNRTLLLLGSLVALLPSVLSLRAASVHRTSLDFRRYRRGARSVKGAPPGSLRAYRRTSTYMPRRSSCSQIFR